MKRNNYWFDGLTFSFDSHNVPTGSAQSRETGCTRLVDARTLDNRNIVYRPVGKYNYRQAQPTRSAPQAPPALNMWSFRRISIYTYSFSGIFLRK